MNIERNGLPWIPPWQPILYESDLLEWGHIQFEIGGSDSPPANSLVEGGLAN